MSRSTVSKLAVWLCCVSTGLGAAAQTPALPDTIALFGNKPTDFLIAGDTLLVLADGQLYGYNLATNAPVLFKNAPKNINCFALDTLGNLYCAIDGQDVLMLGTDHKRWRTWYFEPRNAEYTTSVERLYMLSPKEGYGDTHEGLYRFRNGRFYYPTKIFEMPKLINSYGSVYWPAATYSWGRKNTLWLGYRFGEWGGAYILFNTFENRIQTKYRLSENFRSIIPLSDSLAIGITSISHLSLIESIVYKLYPNSDSILFSTKAGFGIQQEDSDSLKVNLGRYFGAACQELNGPRMLLFTEKGFWKVTVADKDTLVASDFEFWFDPKALWTWGQPDAAGYQLAVTKCLDTPYGFLFLTSSQGIGWYRDDKLIYIR